MSGFGVERALAAGMEQGMDWLLQMDPDELLYPQSESFDITVGKFSSPYDLLCPTSCHIQAYWGLRYHNSEN